VGATPTALHWHSRSRKLKAEARQALQVPPARHEASSEGPLLQALTVIL